MLILKHGKIVSVKDGCVLEGYDVAVDREKIHAIVPAGTAIAGGKEIDCGGGYLLPGLCDLHVHLEATAEDGSYYNGTSKCRYPIVRDWSQYLKVYLALGVTQVRNMSGAKEILDLRERVERGTLVGPHISTLSPILDGINPLWKTSTELKDEQSAKEAVYQAKADGYDGIKIYNNLTAAQFDAILEAAEEAGMTVSGHVPIKVSMERCFDSSLLGYEHIKAIKKGYVEEGGARGKTMSSTLVVQRGMDQYGDAEERERLLALGATRHLSPEALIAWRETSESLSHHDFRLDRTYEEYRRDAAAFVQHGGTLLVGTDSPFPFTMPGYSLHEELYELVCGGLQPAAVLRMATLGAAEFLGNDDRRGSIEVGKDADLLLVSKNPLEDIRNTQDIKGVSFQGVWYDANALDTLLRDVENESAKKV